MVPPKEAGSSAATVIAAPTRLQHKVMVQYELIHLIYCIFCNYIKGATSCQCIRLSSLQQTRRERTSKKTCSDKVSNLANLATINREKGKEKRKKKDGSGTRLTTRTRVQHRIEGTT